VIEVTPVRDSNHFALKAQPVAAGIASGVSCAHEDLPAEPGCVLLLRLLYERALWHVQARHLSR